MNLLKNLILISATLAMTACVSYTPTPEQIKSSSDAGERYFKAKRENILIASCWYTQSCERMFGLTKVFINQYSDMRVELSDSYSVTTFAPVIHTPNDGTAPSNLGKVSLNAVRKPGNDESSTIVLSVTCGGLEAELDVLNNADRYNNTDPAFNHICLDKLTGIYEAFNPFIESRMR